MRALVVYESMYGNTKRIAESIAAGIAHHMPVATMEVSLAPETIEADVELLVVGGPTHVHGMTTAFTRAQAVKQATTRIVSSVGMREWLESIKVAGTKTTASAFDTRLKGPEILTGSAAHGFARKLRAAGARVLTEPESFLVAAKAPQDAALLDGEIERARTWGEALATQLTKRLAAPVA